MLQVWFKTPHIKLRGWKPFCLWSNTWTISNLLCICCHGFGLLVGSVSHASQKVKKEPIDIEMDSAVIESVNCPLPLQIRVSTKYEQKNICMLLSKRLRHKYIGRWGEFWQRFIKLTHSGGILHFTGMESGCCPSSLQMGWLEQDLVETSAE